MKINLEKVNEMLEVTARKVAVWSATFPMLQFDNLGRAKFSDIPMMNEENVREYIYNRGMSYEFKACFNQYLKDNGYLIKDRYDDYTERIHGINAIPVQDFIENYFHLKKADGRLMKIKASRVLSAVHDMWAKSDAIYTRVCDEIKKLRKEGKTYEDYEVQQLTKEKNDLEYGDVFVSQQKMQNECNGNIGVYITVNPLDLLASSGQEGNNPTQFSSCWSLYMDYNKDDDNLRVEREGCYSSPEAQIALGSILNRGMLYIPNGKTLKVCDGTDYEIIGYKERTHVWENDSKLLLEVIYPNRSDTRRKQLQQILNGANIETIDDKVFGDDEYNYIPFKTQDTEGIKNYWITANKYNHVFLDRVCIDIDENYTLKMMAQPRCSYDYNNPDEIPCGHNIVVCSCCGREIDADDDETYYYDHNGDIVCCECIDDHYSRCEDCGEYYKNGDGIWIGEDTWVCDDCLSEHYTRCERCGEWERKDNTYTVYNEHGDSVEYCEHCYNHHTIGCDCCEYTYTEEAINNVDDKCLCDDCYNSNTFECAKCGEVHYKDNMTEIEGEMYCGGCAEEVQLEADVAEAMNE